MKYLIFVVATCLISVTFSFSAEAQLLNRLKKKAKDAAEQKAEEKLAEQVQMMAENMVEKSWNSVFGEMNGDSLSGMRLPFTMNSNVTTEEQYTFDSITTMEIETIKKNGKSEPPVTMAMHFNKEAPYTGTAFSSEEMKKEDGNLFLIYDFKNSAMLMLMDNKKEKFSFAYDWSQSLTQVEAPKDSSGQDINWDEVDQWQGYSKIGQKNILGYNCDGYKTTNEHGTTEIWVSRDADFGETNFFRANANAKQMKGKIPDNYPTGMVMEMTSEDSATGEKTIMKVIEIKKNMNITYAMADYPMMSLGQKRPSN